MDPEVERMGGTMGRHGNVGRAFLVITACATAIAWPVFAEAQDVETVQAEIADVAGAWTVEVETDPGVTTPSWVLEQDGMSLTGSYSSDALGENRIRGSVDGSEIHVRFTASLRGHDFPVEYRGTLGDDGVIRGTVDIASGMMQGRFTAKRTGG